ncbi:MAG: 4Fe-4S binding protein [Nitrospirota bacterium]|nr:4Fe-4S binding protein [Nitrospirota bacterium]
MNAVAEYFRNIADAVTTTIAGMKITLRYWVKEPSITVEYPDRLGPGKTAADVVADRFRGFLRLDLDKCIGCMQCMRACPINCIRITVEKTAEIRMLTRFDVNQAKCMYCGLCVEECPSNALVFSKRFEGACFNMQELCVRHVTGPVPVAKLAAVSTK